MEEKRIRTGIESRRPMSEQLSYKKERNEKSSYILKHLGTVKINRDIFGQLDNLKHFLDSWII